MSTSGDADNKMLIKKPMPGINKHDNVPLITVDDVPVLGAEQMLKVPVDSELARRLEECARGRKKIFVAAREDGGDEAAEKFYGVGALAFVQKGIFKVSKYDEGRENDHDLFFVKPVMRAKIAGPVGGKQLTVTVEEHPYDVGTKAEDMDTRATADTVSEMFAECIMTAGQDATGTALLADLDKARTATEILRVVEKGLPCVNRGMPLAERQELFSLGTTKERLKAVGTIVAERMKIQDIAMQVRKEMEQNASDAKMVAQLNYNKGLIDQQIRKITGDDEDVVEGMKKKLAALTIPEETRKTIERNIRDLGNKGPSSAEFSKDQQHLEFILDLPWNKIAPEEKDMKKVGAILDADHYGLDKVKKGIKSFLAVQMRTTEPKGDIMCLFGPAGVGKTSIAKSIAGALGRPYQRVSLGGVSDESVIRGHRKTFVGSMAGKIMDAVLRAGTNNPVILLDEIDKTGLHHGQNVVESALLELLDPEQNKKFRDHYLGVDFDLSRVLFICSANSLDTMSAPLLNRMNRIHVGGYTAEEKFEIAKRYLVPAQMKDAGFTADELEFTDDALRAIAGKYTREAGVRQLNYRIKDVCREAALKIAESEHEGKVVVSPQNLKDFLGSERHDGDMINDEDEVGVMNGLAYSESGGSALKIEVTLQKGKGEFTHSGSLGDVMKESIQVAKTLIMSSGEELGVDLDSLESKNVHIHFPDGATPKDGPSAGAATTAAIISALTGRKIRRDVAMTGEITTRGKVLPIGGLQEKFQGAVNAGVKEVLIPVANGRDLEDIPMSLQQKLKITKVSNIRQVLDVVFADAAKGEDIPVLEEMPVEIQNRVIPSVAEHPTVM